MGYQLGVVGILVETEGDGWLVGRGGVDDIAELKVELANLHDVVVRVLADLQAEVLPCPACHLVECEGVGLSFAFHRGVVLLLGNHRPRAVCAVLCHQFPAGGIAGFIVAHAARPHRVGRRRDGVAVVELHEPDTVLLVAIFHIPGVGQVLIEQVRGGSIVVVALRGLGHEGSVDIHGVSLFHGDVLVVAAPVYGEALHAVAVGQSLQYVVDIVERPL